MQINAKTAFFIAAGLGLLWLGRKAARSVTATIEAAQPKPIPGVNGFDGLGRNMGERLRGRGRVGRAVTLRRPIGSESRDAAARTRPWYADAGPDAPVDPYQLSPVSERGDAVNTRTRTAFDGGNVGQVAVVEHGMVDAQAETVPYVEPGDAMYGVPSEIDYGDAESGAEFDEQPGALLGAH